jgi:hypothetical protein
VWRIVQACHEIGVKIGIGLPFHLRFAQARARNGKAEAACRKYSKLVE